jgi:hypothetical protein
MVLIFIFRVHINILRWNFNVHSTKCFIIFRLFTEASCKSQVASFTYILQPLVHHKRLPFSGLQIPLADFTMPLIHNSKFPKRLKGTCLCITSSERVASYDAQTAKEKPRKQITSGSSEPFANYAVFSAMYIKLYLQNIKGTTR